MASIKTEIFNLDNSTQLEFLETQKAIVVIDKEKFLVCKRLYHNNAPDSEIAEFLNIPEQKVDFFKYQMELFDDKMRNRKRVMKAHESLQAYREPPRKRELTAEERYRKARDLIAQNFSTNQISKLLKISERSVTRFKRRMREERKRLKSQGRIPTTFDGEEEEFKHLKPVEKLRKARELFDKNMKINEIAEVLKISERSVRRWKDRINKCFTDEELEIELKIDNEEDDIPIEKIDQDLDLDDLEREPKKRKLYVDRDKVEYAKELIENKLSNKDMSLLLEMSIACVRKLKLKILNGTVDELINNDEEYYRNLEAGFDPQLMDSMIITKPEKKPKILLTDRDGKMARLLRENNVRTMDIAKMMNISERSVTRLLAKFKSDIVFEQDIIEAVEKLLAEKAEDYEYTIETEVTEVMEEADETPVLVEDVPMPVEEVEEEIEEEFVEEQEEAIEETDPVEPDATYEEVNVPNLGSKYKIFVSLLLMGTKVKDMAKMLDVSEKKVLRWKEKFLEHTKEEDEMDDDD